MNFYYYIICISASLALGYAIGRFHLFKVKNFGVSKKMYFTLENQELDRRIQLACDLEDYEEAWRLKRKQERIEKKIKRLEKRDARLKGKK